jgi:hypothetical protein
VTICNQNSEIINRSMFITSGIAAVMNQFNGGDPATTE